MEERKEGPERIDIKYDKYYAKQILMRAAKYVWSYLEGYPIFWKLIEKEGNPEKGKPEQYILVIRVWIPMENTDEEEEIERETNSE